MHEGLQFSGLPQSGKLRGFLVGGPAMQDINPIDNKIKDLRGRVESLRGYL